MIVIERLEISNKVLEVFNENLKIYFSVKNNRLHLNWVNCRSKSFSYPWAVQGGSSYPSWHHKLSCGGTQITAIAQLALWIRDRPCYPIQSWEYWTGKTILLEGREVILPLLKNSDYPKDIKCAFCGAKNKRFDWYWFSVHPKDSGFGCIPRCEQIKIKEMPR